MAYEVPVGPFLTFPASTGLKQYTFVDLSTNASDSRGKLIKPVAGIGKAIGVLVSSGTTGSTRQNQTQSVQVWGVAKVIGGSNTIKVGSVVMAATDGRGELATTNSTKMFLGRALFKSTSTSAQIVSVLLQSGGII